MIRALINGNWKQVPDEHLLIGGDSFAFDNGLYETFRTIEYRPVFLDPHLDRLLRTAGSLGMDIPYARDEIYDLVKKVISEFHEPEQRVRILAVTDKLIIYTSPLNINPEIYNGVKVITVTAKRDTPDIKTTDYHTCLSAWEKANRAKCFEAILCDKNGDIFEGTRSNVFWVTTGKLWTRKGDVLPGVTRQTIISKSLIPIVFGQLNKKNIDQVDELFISNSGSGIVPVIQVDHQLIGKGIPGKLTRTLLNHYDTWIKKDAGLVK